MNRRALLSRLPLLAALPWVAKRAVAEPPPAPSTSPPVATNAASRHPGANESDWVLDCVDQVQSHTADRWVTTREKFDFHSERQPRLRLRVVFVDGVVIERTEWMEA